MHNIMSSKQIQPAVQLGHRLPSYVWIITSWEAAGGGAAHFLDKVARIKEDGKCLF